MTRVIHTGDTHLGYRQYHAPARREDFVAAFEQVIEDAVADDVDAVVHAGDLFHDRQPSLEDVMETLSLLRRLDDADVPFLAIVGNHEGKRDAQWLDLFESLGLATHLDENPVLVGDTAFYGLDFVPRSKRGDLDYDFEPVDAAHAALVTHGLFEPFDLGEWDATEILDASPVEFDVMLLGDNHTPATKRVDGTWLTYCGSTERTSASERDERGYNLVVFDDGVDVRRRGLETREFVFVDVTLREGEGVDRVRERVGQHDLRDAVVVVTVEGDGEAVTPAAIEEYAAEQGALVARVNDRREREETAETPEVSFADPDDAVAERVRELGLSEAARALDETIRASKVADSKVADTVADRVRDLVEEGEERAFEPADVDAGETADDTDRAAVDPEVSTDDSETVESTDDGDTTASTADDDADDSDTDAAETDSEGDGQASVEEFL